MTPDELDEIRASGEGMPERTHTVRYHDTGSRVEVERGSGALSIHGRSRGLLRAEDHPGIGSRVRSTVYRRGEPSVSVRGEIVGFDRDLQLAIVRWADGIEEAAERSEYVVVPS